MIMTKSIYRRQQEKDITRLIKGQRILYSKSKDFNGANLFLISICIFTGLVILYFNKVSFIFPMLSIEAVRGISNLLIIITIIASFKFDERAAEFKNKAAQIQQYVDADLYSACIGKPNAKWGNLPTLAQLEDWLRGYHVDIDKMTLGPWYNDYSNEIPFKQILNCQHENLRWEDSLHDEFKKFVVAIIVIGVFAFFVIELCINAQIMWILMDIGPFVPAIRYLYSIWSKIQKDKARINKAMEKYYSIYDKIQNNQTVKINDLIDLQILIYENRRDSYPIPDWFHKWNEKKNSSINS